MRSDWPVAEVDPVRRLHILAASIPGAAVHEALLPAPFEQVWATASDLQAELPHLITDIRTARLDHAGGGLQLHARGRLGQRARFEVVLQPGWCLLQSRFLLGGMAARPEGEATRFAFLSGVRVRPAPLARVLAALIRPFLPRVIRRFSRRVDERRDG